MAIFKWGVLLVVLLMGAVALGAGIATAHDGGTEVRITAMRLDDGRIEFALQERDGEGWGERILPSSRFFPTTSSGRWLNSTPITVGEVTSMSSGATATAAAAATPTPDSLGDWTRYEGANVNGDYLGYALTASSHSGFSWEDPPILLVRCGVGNTDNDLLWIATPYLLHGGDNTAGVNYRFAADSSATRETWRSDDELDSSVTPNTGTFATRLAQATGLLYLEFVSLYDSDSHTATFDVTGATSVAADLTCF